MNVTIYTKPGCPPCRATKRELDKMGIVYRQFDVTEDPAAAQAVKDLGYTSVPVVHLDDGRHWSGYRPTEIEKLN